MNVNEISNTLEKELLGESKAAMEVDKEVKDSEWDAKAIDAVPKHGTYENKVCEAGMNDEEKKKLSVQTDISEWNHLSTDCT